MFRDNSLKTGGGNVCWSDSLPSTQRVGLRKREDYSLPMHRHLLYLVDAQTNLKRQYHFFLNFDVP